VLFRIRLRLTAPLGTPMVSGTLFGHLCWAYFDRHGEAALVDWLEAMEQGERAPFLISDAFPAEHLPRPLLAPEIPNDDLSPDEARRRKQRRKAMLVRRDDFLKLRSRATVEREWLDHVVESKPSLLVQHAHNVIDRLRQTTPERAGLWFIEDDWGFCVLPERDLYVQTDLEQAELAELFRIVGENGFGRDVTYGRGLFSVEAVAIERELAEPLEGADVRLVSLSHGCLTANMGEARWQRTTHFGKLAARAEGQPGADGTPARPWKKPLLLLRPGCTFRPVDDGPFGALLDRVHLDLPQVRFNAWHLAIPYREARA
jgi:CRISPR-associated protein Csm4